METPERTVVRRALDKLRRAPDTVRQVARAIQSSLTFTERTPDKTAKRQGGQSMVWKDDDLHARFVDAVNGGRPVLATYSWVYGRLFGEVPRPWSQGHGERVITIARETSPRQVNNLGVTLLDTFVVSLKSGEPSAGHWERRTPPYCRETWKKIFTGAVVLHGQARAPWE